MAFRVEQTEQADLDLDGMLFAVSSDEALGQLGVEKEAALTDCYPVAPLGSSRPRTRNLA
jgi:hypothetical protein